MFLKELNAMDGVTVETSFKTYHVAEGMRQAGGKQASIGGLGVKHVHGIKHLWLRPIGDGACLLPYNFVQHT
jgi:hypothetical protein